MAAEWIIRLVAVYAGAGLLFALAFVGFGLERVDPAARGAPVRFRLLVLPGCAALWPYMAVRWAKARRTETKA
jgi:hypothetical protein